MTDSTPKLRLFLFACLAPLAGCPGGEASDDTTLGDASSGAASSGTASTGSSGATSEDPDPTGEPTDTGATETGSSEPGSTGTGSTDTGAADCEVSWVVPDVAADELAAHDLRWVGCELTACGPEDAPRPGQPSALCEPIDLADAPLMYLGNMHPNQSGAFTTEDVISQANIAWLDGPRHIYRYDDNVYILTESDAATDQLDVYYTVRALEILRTVYPSAYQQLLVDQAEFPAEPPLDGFGWKNRVRSTMISFDTSPFAIVAGVTVLDAAPVANMQTGFDEYSNVAAISIDRETILGAAEDVGSRPVYGKPTDDENFLRYMREGAVEALVHELVRLRVDRRNSVDADMNGLYNRRALQGACAQFELEEALVASTSLLYFRVAGGLSDAYLDYYDVVLDNNRAVLEACPEYAMWAEQFTFPSGVDERYDLRLFDLQ